jgi:hypothetical protein
MKKNVSRIMIAMFVSFLALGAAGVATAAGSAMEHKPMDAKSMTGEITAVNADSGTFTVKPAEAGAQSVTFHTDGATKFQRDGKESSESSLSTGAKVTVQYESKDGQLVALAVHIA